MVDIFKGCNQRETIADTINELTGLKEAETTARHVCSQCGKSFYSEGYLKQHLNLHADETPYKCRCGAQFKLKLYLARHMKIHSGQFTCKYCPAAFPCASLLKGHENSHTGNKEFSCEICGKLFYAKGDVRKHRQKVHEKKRRRIKASSR
uniref:C2H2-type domain-containing protein n=1 Tax=Anopheles atroparvus TaxID=41427 RepID=A0A182JKI9_ANOAO